MKRCKSGYADTLCYRVERSKTGGVPYYQGVGAVS